MPCIKVLVLLPDDRAMRICLPADTAIRDLMNDLLQLVGLPSKRQDGLPQEYLLKASATGQQIRSIDTLARAGISAESVLRIQMVGPEPFKGSGMRVKTSDLTTTLLTLDECSQKIGDRVASSRCEAAAWTCIGAASGVVVNWFTAASPSSFTQSSLVIFGGFVAGSVIAWLWSKLFERQEEEKAQLFLASLKERELGPGDH